MKMNCDIIQDLIPSYVDEICSEASKKCVEEHLAECENCKKIVVGYQENEIVGSSMERKEFDGFKKVKRKMQRQSVISYCLLLFVAGFGYYSFQSNSADFSYMTYYILFMICMVATFFVTRRAMKYERIQKKQWALLGISVLTTVVTICSFYNCMMQVINGVIPFGMEAEKLGPFIHFVWGILCLIQVIVFEEMLRSVFEKQIRCQWMLTVSLTGIFILLVYVFILGRMAEPSNMIELLHRVNGTVVGLGLLGTVIHVGVMKLVEK